MTNGVPVDGLWYDKKEKTNMSKVATPELAEKIVANIKQTCPASADNMSGTRSPPRRLRAACRPARDRGPRPADPQRRGD